MFILKADKIVVINKNKESNDSIKEKLQTLCTNQYLTEPIELKDIDGNSFKTTMFEHTFSFVTRSKYDMVDKIKFLLMSNRSFSKCYSMKYNIIESPQDIVVSVLY